MSNQSVTFTINLGGNAYKGVLQLDNAVEQVIGSVKNATSVTNLAETHSISMSSQILSARYRKRSSRWWDPRWISSNSRPTCARC